MPNSTDSAGDRASIAEIQLRCSSARLRYDANPHSWIINGTKVAGESVIAPDDSPYHGKTFTFLSLPEAEAFLAKTIPVIIAVQQQSKDPSTDNLEQAVNNSILPPEPGGKEVKSTNVGFDTTILFSNGINYRMSLLFDQYGLLKWKRTAPHHLLIDSKPEEIWLTLREYLVRRLTFQAHEEDRFIRDMPESIQPVVRAQREKARWILASTMIPGMESDANLSLSELEDELVSAIRNRQQKPGMDR
jgi:hypothetical protein